MLQKGRKTTQKTIPLTDINEQGIFRCGREFSIMFELQDINYSDVSDQSQAAVLIAYENLIKGMASTDRLQMLMINRKVETTVIDRAVTIPEDPAKDPSGLIPELNGINRERALKGSNNIVKCIYLVVSSSFSGFAAAEPWAKRQTQVIQKAVLKTGSKAVRLNAADRLKVLRQIGRAHV